MRRPVVAWLNLCSETQIILAHYMRSFLSLQSVIFILTFLARANLGTFPLCAKAFTVLADAFVVLACTPSSDLSFLLLLPKSVRALLECHFDGRFTCPGWVFVKVEASNACANRKIARLSSLKASAVEFQAS